MDDWDSVLHYHVFVDRVALPEHSFFSRELCKSFTEEARWGKKLLYQDSLLFLHGGRITNRVS